MSGHDARAKSSVVSRRPQLPCPTHLKNFPPKQTRTGNYSYAEIEFRPMIVTEEGAFSAPIKSSFPDEVDQDEALQSPVENLQWDDDLGIYKEEDGFDESASNTCNYGGVGLGPERETVIGDDAADLESQMSEGYSSDYIYDTPIDASTEPKIDASQLYAQVDFSAKKKKYPNNDSCVKVDSNDAPYAYTEVRTVSQFHQPNVDNERSKLYVKIPEKREHAPPPIPKPYAGMLLSFIITLVH